jgi:hypothetical protein
MEKRINTSSGEVEGKTAMWGYVAAVIGILFGLSGVALTIIHLTQG